jgi:toxin ParE1/3/4
VRTKPVVPRQLASADVDDAIDHCLREGGQLAALGFIDALARAYAHIGRHPATGLPRYAHELNLPGLRSWPLARFPYLVFYLEQSDHIDVWRLLHQRRDVPAWMQDPDGA